MKQAYALGLLAAFLLPAADHKKPPEGKYSGEQMEVEARLYLDKDDIRRLLGAEMPQGIAVVEIALTPRGEKPFKLFADDFYLKSDKDGQRSQPYTPGQIAGRGALVVSSSGGRGVMMGDDRGPVWGGIGGGRPRRIGTDGGAIGNAPSESRIETTTQTGAGEKDNPLLEILKKRTMPEGELSQPVSGLLYFPLEGKQKVKDIELQYRGREAKFSLRFRQ